jgi:hypothetical protein
MNMDDFIRKRNELARRVDVYARKHNIPVYVSRKMTEKENLEYAEEIRNEMIDYCRKYDARQHVLCPSCCRREVRKFERDRDNNLAAYQQMTGKEILMSEERENQLRQEETSKFLTDLRKFQEESRKAHIWVR